MQQDYQNLPPPPKKNPQILKSPKQQGKQLPNMTNHKACMIV